MFAVSLTAWLFVIVLLLIVVALFAKVSIDRRSYHARYRSYFSLQEDEREGSITITNHGPGHMINCFIRLTIEDTRNSTSFNHHIHVPMIAEHQSTVFSIPKEINENDRLLQKIYMEYQSQSEERLKYYQTTVQENNLLTVKHALYRVGLLTSRRMYEYDTTKTGKSPSHVGTE